MKAAIYCRVSTEDQQRKGTSLETQKEACLAKAKLLGFEVSQDSIFREAWPGADTDRPKLNELRSLVRQRLIDCVVCYSTDRLARNPIHIAIIAEECEKRGIELIFVTEPLDNSPEGALIRYVKGYAAQIEREKIRERSLRGKREKARMGKFATGGIRLFGYNVVDGKRVVNLTEAEIVKQIFYWFVGEQYTLYRAASELNQNGVMPPRASKWSGLTVRRLLLNPAYKGLTYAFRYQAIEPKKPKKALRSYSKTSYTLRDKKEWIVVPNATPLIVEPSIWDKAQEQLQRNRVNSPRNRKHEYLLINGRLRCGVCGHGMVGGCQKKVNGDWLLYRCICNVKSNYYDRCLQPSIATSKIEPLVWNEVTKVLKNPQLVIEALNQQRNDTARFSLEAEQILIDNRIKQISKEEHRYLRLYGQGKIDEQLLLIEVDRVREQKESLEKKLAELKERERTFEQADIKLDRVSDVLATLNERLDNADYDLKQTALDALDVKATLYPNGHIHIDGSIPTNVELSYSNSIP